MNPLRPLAALILCLPLAAQTVTLQPAPGVKATEVRTLPFAAHAPLRVKNVNGHIRVTVWDRPEAEFTGAFTPARKGEQVKVILEPREGGLDVRVEHPKHTENGPTCDMDLKVPRSARVVLESVNGEVEAREIGGSAECRTVNGAITVEGVSGAFKAETVNGSIRAHGLQAGVSGRTVNGAITLGAKGLKGRLEATTVNGELKISAPGARDVKAGRRRVEATLGTGEGQLKLQTVNGDITVE
ncbi:MAG TPA: DUF4097 family beta strand repeat-containing protein [Holophaga sp.]|nr:DUF4097 family beta strand repeat-containing protein [Holophaga sp.]